MVKRCVCASVCLCLLDREKKKKERKKERWRNRQCEGTGKRERGPSTDASGCKGLTSFPWTDIMAEYLHILCTQSQGPNIFSSKTLQLTLLPSDTDLLKAANQTQIIPFNINWNNQKQKFRFSCLPHPHEHHERVSVALM